MDHKTALKSIAEHFPGGQKACAGFLGLELTGFRNRLYEIKGQRISMDDIVALSVASGRDEWVQSICHEHGGVFVRLPGCDADRDDLLNKFNALYAEIGRLSAEFQSAVADDNVDKDERARLERVGMCVSTRTQELLALIFSVYCKGGV